MKYLRKTSLLLAAMLLSLTVFTSCDWDNSPEPEYPSKVTYSISADYTEFDGPEQLLLDIKSWIEDNKTGYLADASYSTGAASEFVNQDAQAAKVMDQFTAKFINYLQTTVKEALAAGTYGEGVQVNARFYTYVQRDLGQDRDVKVTLVPFVYPDNASTAQ